MSTSKNFVIGFAICGVCVASAPAQAQSGWEAGYQLAKVPDETLPVGGSIGVVGQWTPTWSIVGEIAAARESHDLAGLEAEFTILDVGGGLRWTPQLSGARFTPFVQILVGAVRRTIDVDAENLTPEIRDALEELGLGVPIDQSETDFMFQPGVGVGYRVTGRWSALAAMKFTETLNENEFDIGDEFRLFLGVRLDF
jgi:hypothetical protein